ncbi:LemA family protein [bacterium]|nr:LemA family protein [bacterium]
MNKGIKIFIGFIVVFVLIGFAGLRGCNSIITREENVKAAWAQVENVLQRRADLIPNYVETVKGYAQHEKQVLIDVTNARAKVTGAGSIPDKIEANNQLSSALSRLLVVVERYPDLKANQNFIRLQDELAGTENRIAVERKRYNETVRDFNTSIRKIPGRFYAALLGVQPAPYYEVEEGAKQVPKVSF